MPMKFVFRGKIYSWRIYQPIKTYVKYANIEVIPTSNMSYPTYHEPGVNPTKLCISLFFNFSS